MSNLHSKLSSLAYFKDHAILIIGSNVIGFLGLLMSILILKLGTQEEFNQYSAYTAFLFILAAPTKILKNLSTVYGVGFFSWIKSECKLERKPRQIALVLGIITLSILTVILITQSTDGDTLSSIFLVLATLCQFALLSYIGILQNDKQFGISTWYLFLQNLLKLLLAVSLFVLIGNLGVWFATFITSFFVFLLLVNQSKKSTLVTKVVENLDLSDVLLNFLILVAVEMLFSIDSILVLKNLSSSDAYAYNALVIIKKSMFFAAFGLSAITLSDSKKAGVNKVRSLLLNLLVATLIGIGLGFVLIVLNKPVLEFFGLDSSYFMLLIKFITSTILFTLLMLISLWFTSVDSKVHRILLLIGIVIFVIVYSFNIHNLDHILNTFIIGVSVLILYDFGLIISLRKKQSINN